MNTEIFQEDFEKDKVEDIDMLLEIIKDEISEEARELFQREDNYNNADITSGQWCYSESDIDEMLTKVLIKRLKGE